MDTALNLSELNQSVDVTLEPTIVSQSPVCPVCSKPWLVIGNLLAGVWQEYMADCTCEEGK